MSKEQTPKPSVLINVLQSVEQEGYIQSSIITRNYFGNHGYERPEWLVTFNGGVIGEGRGAIKYSGFDLLGVGNLHVYFDNRNKRPVEIYLEGLFLKNNPNSNQGIRSAFTKLLHEHRLHWSRCLHEKISRRPFHTDHLRRIKGVLPFQNIQEKET